MKKLIAIIGIGLALCATASTQTSKEYVDKKDNEIRSSLNSHEANTNNPHGVTADQVGAYSKREADDTFVAEETDPTVPSWAKLPQPPAANVNSVNDKGGDVWLYAEDVGAVPNDESYEEATNKAYQAARAHENSVIWSVPINRGRLPQGTSAEVVKYGESSRGAAQFNLATFGMIDDSDTIIKKAVSSGPGFDGSAYQFDDLFTYTTSSERQGLTTRTHYTWWGNFFMDWDRIAGNKPSKDKLWDRGNRYYQDVFGGVYEVVRSEMFGFVSPDYGYAYTNIEWEVPFAKQGGITGFRSTWFYQDTLDWNQRIIREKISHGRLPSEVSWKRIIYFGDVVWETDLSDCTEEYPDTLVFNFDGGGTFKVNSTYTSSTNKIGQVVYEDDIYSKDEIDEKIASAGKVKKVANVSPDNSGNVPLTATDVGAATGEQVQQLQAVVTTYTAFVDGSNVVFSITNYLSGAYVLNEAKFKILELKDGGYQEMYNSRTEILLHVTNETQKIVGFVNAATNALAGTISGKADKAWGKYTSAGGEAPSNTVYMTAPNTVFAGGMEYERVAVGEGAICVLTTKGAPVYTQGDEGTFKFQDDGGINYFGFAKSDSYTQGCRTDGITVQNQMVTLHYDITMSGVPCIWYKEDLTSSEPWEQLNLPDRSAVPGATHQVQWEENPDPGTQECHINVNGEPKGFFKATVEVAGSAKFMSNMPADLSGGIFCTDGQHKVGIDWNNGNPRLVEVQ